MLWHTLLQQCVHVWPSDNKENHGVLKEVPVANSYHISWHQWLLLSSHVVCYVTRYISTVVKTSIINHMPKIYIASFMYVASLEIHLYLRYTKGYQKHHILVLFEGLCRSVCMLYLASTERSTSSRNMF